MLPSENAAPGNKPTLALIKTWEKRLQEVTLLFTRAHLASGIQGLQVELLGVLRYGQTDLKIRKCAFEQSKC